MRRLKQMSVLMMVLSSISTAFTACAVAGDLEPSAAPASTMHSLEDIYTLAEDISSNIDPFCFGVAQTGQTTSYATGDDGDLEKGIAWPAPRFTDNGDGTVADNLTGLIWLKNANCFGGGNWSTALSSCNTLANGTCSLTDGSTAGDWRLPNINEFESILDCEHYGPALPTGHPFSGVQSAYYWSSSTRADDTDDAWIVNMNSGSYGDGDKTGSYYAWPVRNND